MKAAMKTASPAEKASVVEGPGAKADGPLVAERTWTNADGKPLAAALVKVDQGKGTFRRKDGTTFTYEVAKLSSTDQELIAAARQP